MALNFIMNKEQELEKKLLEIVKIRSIEKSVGVVEGSSAGTTVNPIVVPNDFFPFPKKLKDVALQDRYRIHSVLMDSPQDTKGAIAMIWMTLDRDLGTFEASLSAVRCVILRIADSLINSEFARKMEERYPELKEQKLKSIGDFAQLYSERTNDKKMREMADFALHGLWGTSNAFLAEAEKSTLEKLNVQCSGLLSDGSMEKRHHGGGTVKKLLVKKKSSMMEIIRNHGRKSHKELLYRRKIGVKEEGGVKLEDENALAPVVMLLKADKETHGFVGYIGICEGHPELRKKDQQGNSLQQSVPTDTEVMEYVRKMVVGGVTTLDELKKRILAEKQANGTVSSSEGSQEEPEQAPVLKDPVLGGTVITAQLLQKPVLQGPVPEKPRGVQQSSKPHSRVTPARLMGQEPGSTDQQNFSPGKDGETLVTPGGSGDRRNEAAGAATPTHYINQHGAATLSGFSLQDFGDLENFPWSDVDESEFDDSSPCHHDKVNNFKEWDKGYFTENFIKKREGRWPHSCGLCKKTFYREDGGEPDIKVGMASNKVHGCENVDKMDHVCQYALCEECYLKELAKKTVVRKRTPRQVPKKSELKLCCPCDHDRVDNFKEWNKGYFAPKFIKKKKGKWPKDCSICSKTFYRKDGGEPDIKVGMISNKVHGCENVDKPDHPCLYALCEKCHVKEILKSPRKPKRGRNADDACVMRSTRRKI